MRDHQLGNPVSKRLEHNITRCRIKFGKPCANSSLVLHENLDRGPYSPCRLMRVPHGDKSEWGVFRCQGTKSRAIWMRLMLLSLDLVWWHHPLWRSFILPGTHGWRLDLSWISTWSHPPWPGEPIQGRPPLLPLQEKAESVFIWNPVSQTSHVEDWKYPLCCGEWAFYFWESWAPWFKGKHIPKRD